MPEFCDNREEWLNAATHGLGLLASVVGGAVLMDLAARSGDSWQMLGAAVYGVSLLVLYCASTLYHAVQSRPLKARLRVLDHCAIYLLIAGTYTPFSLGVLRGVGGWGLLAVVWLAALAGIVYKLFLIDRHPRLSTATYLAMGWLAVLVLPTMAKVLTVPALLWLIGGGVAYTTGTYFYHCRSIRYAHAIWHGFVLTGSACHFMAVLAQVMPAAGA